jgi:hypothetical protein
MTTLAPNFVVRPYRGVSVQSVPTLEPARLRTHLLSRRVYRRTEFLIAVCADERAIVRIVREPGDAILVPVADVEVIASGDEVAFVEAPDVDTGNATQLAAAAAASGVRSWVYVVQGRFQHINFIVDPQPVTIDVVEVIPPGPPKLLEMARAMVAVDDELPPLELRFAAIDLRELIASAPAAVHLLPCRSGGLPSGAGIEFLDEGPPWRADRTLVGCERSRQIHAAMYGRPPQRCVDFCPRVRTDPGRPALTLIKCCIRERGVERRGPRQVLVPWGATLDEVRAGLRLLCGLPAFPPAPVVTEAAELTDLAEEAAAGRLMPAPVLASPDGERGQAAGRLMPAPVWASPDGERGQA